MEVEVQTETTDAQLVRVKAERDALARHIECLIAPISQEEAQAAWVDFNDGEFTMAQTLERFVAKRQAAGQYAALS